MWYRNLSDRVVFGIDPIGQDATYNQHQGTHSKNDNALHVLP